MDQSHRVLDYAPRMRRGPSAFWRAMVYMAVAFVLFMGGAACGRVVAHLLVRQQYMADGWVFVNTTSPTRFPAAGLPQAQRIEIVTEALSAARTNQARGSLPVSADVALRKSEFTPYASPREVHIAYTDVDPQAVDRMLPPLLSAYAHVQAAAWSLTPRTAFDGWTQSRARPVQTIKLDNLSSLAGSCVGVLVFVALARHRKMRANSAV